MRKNLHKAKNNKHDNGNGLIPNSFRFISSCINTVSSNVRSAGASVAGSIGGESSDELRKDQVLWSCFDILELGPSSIKRVLLLGYTNGFQVLDVDDGSNFSELVSSRDGPVTFLQIQPVPERSEGHEGFRMSHPLLLVVASEETRSSGPSLKERDGYTESQMGNPVLSPRAVRFYSLRSHNYVHVLRFRSTVYMVRCSPRIVAVGLASQIYCFDALTLENKFSVLTYPISQLGGNGLSGINIGYGPMAVGPRWLAYASNNPLLSNIGRLSPQSLSPSPGVSPSTSPGNGSLVARYAMESSKQLATGLFSLGDMGYKTLSKYCHDFLPDGSSSPVPPNSSWKAGRGAAHSTETDNAGMVVIKDFVSKAVVSQFRAHTSPISALCFDPSGTLLVTASIHGNNINIFRILPSSQNGSGTRNFDWNTSHVHLYKLHRGMTSAVIQDICFSHYSQWVAVVSSRGTCHIFVLSPFGGETGIQLHNSKISGPTLSTFASVPWWSTSSFTKDRTFSPPAPAAVTLSVVSRIKNVNFGWLNTVTSAGKVSVPPGVIAAAFHSSVRRNSAPNAIVANALEHLLVYTPSGYVIQYELVPSFGGEQGEFPLRNATASMVQMQDEDLRVKVEPIQWWDVCRRADWPEKEECIGGVIAKRHDISDFVMNNSDDDVSVAEKELIKPQERSHWYLSNAEVQVRSGRVPVWQKSKIYFHVMAPQLSEEHEVGGEIDIETIPVHEVEVRQKDLLPVFDGSHGINPGWTDGRVFATGRYSPSSSNCDGSNEKFPEDSSVSHFRTSSYSAGSSRAPSEMQNLLQMERQKSDPILAPTVNNNNDAMNRPSTIISSLDENYVMNSPSPVEGQTIRRGAESSESVVTSDASNPGSNRSDSSMNIIDEGPMHEDIHDLLHFGHTFQEEYCKPSNDQENRILDHKKISEEDGDDDMLGGVFAFSEEC